MQKKKKKRKKKQGIKIVEFFDHEFFKMSKIINNSEKMFLRVRKKQLWCKSTYSTEMNNIAFYQYQ